MSPGDPRSWTVDELVNELCYNPALLQAMGFAKEHYPDQAFLEQQLRRHKINGSRFLTSIDVRTLQYELGFKDPRQRKALIQLTEHLCKQSRQHAGNAATIGVETMDVNHTHLGVHPNVSGISAQDHPVDTVVPKRRKIAQLTMEPPRAVTMITRPVSENWDHLQRWEQVNDNNEDIDMAELDNLDDENSNGGDPAEDELSDALENENDMAEPSNQTQGRCKLSQEIITRIINECIAHYTEEWEPNKGLLKEEKVVYDTVKMWADAEAKSRRQQLIAHHTAEVEHYTDVLDSLCREITSHPSVTTSTIRRKCKNLEVTINNLELAKWLLSIYELPPDSDSDDDGCNADGGQRQTRNLEPQSTPVTQVLQYATEIADSGSPPGTSPGDAEEALPVGHERCPAANEKTLSYHKTTSDTRIAVTIETHTPSTSALPLQHDSSFESPLNHGDDPEHASITTVRRWKWSDLVKNQDRKRVVMKAIHELRAGDREDLRSRLNLVGRAKLGREVKAYIDMLHRKESRIHGVLARDLLKIGMISNLFVSWWLCDNSFLKPPSRQQVEELKQYLEESLSDFGIFFDLVSTVMKTTFSNEALQHPERPSQAEIIEISDDDEVSGSQQACAIVFD